MLLVPTYLGPSTIHGVGLFAAAPIARGETVWKFDSWLDRIYDDALVTRMPREMQAHLETYGYRRNGMIYLCGDDARFTNHADEPNLMETPDTRSIAARAIAQDEELTEDYRAFDEDGVQKLVFENISPLTHRTYVVTHYYGAADDPNTQPGHAYYRNRLHLPKHDAVVPQDAVMGDLITDSGARDGDEVAFFARRTGRRPFGERKVRQTACPGTYRREPAR